MSNANSVPRALVDFLELTTQGRTPDTLTSGIQLVLEGRDFYLNQSRERVVLDSISSGLVNGVFDYAIRPAGVVPQNETWLLYAYTVQASTLPGQLVSVAPLVLMPALGLSRQPFQLGPKVNVIDPTLASVLLAPMDREPIWLPPNSILGFVVSDKSVGLDLQVFGFADYARYRI